MRMCKHSSLGMSKFVPSQHTEDVRRKDKPAKDAGGGGTQSLACICYVRETRSFKL